MSLPCIGSSVSKSLYCWCNAPSIWRRLPGRSYVFARNILSCMRRRGREFLTTLFFFFAQIDFVSTETRLSTIFSSGFFFWLLLLYFQILWNILLVHIQILKRKNFHSKKFLRHQHFSPLSKYLHEKNKAKSTHNLVSTLTNLSTANLPPDSVGCHCVVCFGLI